MKTSVAKWTDVVLTVTVLSLLSCQQTRSPETRPSPTPSADVASSKKPLAVQRFLFPQSSGTFAPASVALDTETGQLCRTYEWKETAGTNLPLCAKLASYGLFELHVEKYIEATKDFEPAFDPFDPLGLFTRADKAKLTLNEKQIRQAASQYGLSYEEAKKGARESGYHVEADK
jgi:hypothetical protein